MQREQKGKNKETVVPCKGEGGRRKRGIKSGHSISNQEKGKGGKSSNHDGKRKKRTHRIFFSGKVFIIVFQANSKGKKRKDEGKALLIVYNFSRKGGNLFQGGGSPIRK